MVFTTSNPKTNADDMCIVSVVAEHTTGIYSYLIPSSSFAILSWHKTICPFLQVRICSKEKVINYWLPWSHWIQILKEIRRGVKIIRKRMMKHGANQFLQVCVKVHPYSHYCFVFVGCLIKQPDLYSILFFSCCANKNPLHLSFALLLSSSLPHVYLSTMKQ